MEPVILVQGGAGNGFDESMAQAGWQILSQGGKALDAAEIAVRVLEDDPAFDTGHGSFLNADNEVEIGAMVMDTHHIVHACISSGQLVD
jgi:beta-aspartyl-peptidase (threonine type)